MRSLNDVLIETIREVISNVFDDETSQIIFQYIEENGLKNPDGIINVFTNVLPRILGSGYVIIEDLIVETLYSKYGRKLRWKRGYGLKDYINDLINSELKELHGR